MEKLIKIKNKYAKKIECKIKKINTNETEQNLVGLLSFCNNIITHKAEIEKYTKQNNSEFIEKINSEEIQKEFTLSDRKKVYDLYIKEITIILNSFQKKHVFKKK